MKKNIMVMCTGNSFRSHMAEAYIRHFGEESVSVVSSGVKAGGSIYPWAIKLMKEENIDISQQRSEQVDVYLDDQFDYLLTVCDNAQATCPEFPNPVGEHVHHSFEDYSPQGELSEEQYMETLRPIRNEIKQFCKTFVKEKL